MKKIVLTIILYLLFSTGVDAAPFTSERTPENNYGVNKKWTITDKNRDEILATPLVNASEKIYDFSNILTADEEKIIYNKIMDFKKNTGMEFIFVSVNLPYTNDATNENYAANFYDYNDFGLDNSYYSGVLLLRNTYEQDPYYNVYMFGEAQMIYTRSRADNVLDDVYPYFVNKKYRDGLELFFSEYLNYYWEGVPKEMENYYINEMGFLVRKYNPPILLAIIVGLVISGVSITIMVGNNKLVRPATKAQEYLNTNSVKIPKKLVTFFSTHTTSHTISSSSSGGGSGGSSSGSSGGGHSSGGGRHG